MTNDNWLLKYERFPVPGPVILLTAAGAATAATLSRILQGLVLIEAGVDLKLNTHLADLGSFFVVAELGLEPGAIVQAALFVIVRQRVHLRFRAFPFLIQLVGDCGES